MILGTFLEIAGFYHIVNRGVERRNIFLEPEDYDFFMKLLSTFEKNYELTNYLF